MILFQHVRLSKLFTLLNYSYSDRFNMRSRNEILNNITTDNNFDMVIIGGGINGAGTLLSSSMNNLRSLLIEVNDFGSGTSSKSTKLLHGGLRYLENFFKPSNDNRNEDLKLVFESLKERNILLNIAPYLNRQIGLMIPCQSIFEALYYYSGCMFYHFLNYIGSINCKYRVDRPIFLSRKQVNQRFPQMSSKYKWGVLMFDGQTNDSALVTESIFTAVSKVSEDGKYNSNALNYVSIQKFKFDKSNQIEGLVLLDKISQLEFEVSCKVIVSTAGVYNDIVKREVIPNSLNNLCFSEGVHVGLESEDNFRWRYLDKIDVGVLVPRTSDGRVMFFIPWENGLIAGTTDKFIYDLRPRSIEIERVNEIHSCFSSYFPNSSNKITSVWSGVRPLIVPPYSDILDLSSDSKSIKRSHSIQLEKNLNFISVNGGKLTIFRKMGEEAVGLALKLLQKEKLSNTRTSNLIGTFPYTNIKQESIIDNDSYVEYHYTQYIDDFKLLTRDVSLYLIRRYGYRSLLITDIIKGQNNKAEILLDNYPYTIAEIEFLCKYEMALFADDIINYRLPIGRLNQNDANRIKHKIETIINNIQNS